MHSQQNIKINQHCSDDKMEKNEMGGICGTYGGEDKRIQGFGGKT